MSWLSGIGETGNKGYFGNQVRSGNLVPIGYRRGQGQYFAAPGTSINQALKNGGYWLQGDTAGYPKAGVGMSGGPSAIAPMNPQSEMTYYGPRQQSGGVNLGGGGASPITGNVSTPIEANEIYPQAAIQRQVNQIRASTPSDLSYAQKQYSTPGVSRSAGTQSRGMADLLQQRMSGEADAQGLVQQANAANAQHLLAGQYAQGQDLLTGAGLMAQLNAMQQRDARTRQRSTIDTLGDLMTWY